MLFVSNVLLAWPSILSVCSWAGLVLLMGALPCCVELTDLQSLIRLPAWAAGGGCWCSLLHECLHLVHFLCGAEDSSGEKLSTMLCQCAHDAGFPDIDSGMAALFCGTPACGSRVCCSVGKVMLC